jgi:hypothetical protein
MRSNLTIKLFIFALLLGCLPVSPAKGAEVYGRIRGTVTDPSGAMVPNVKITVTNVATGVSRTATSAAVLCLAWDTLTTCPARHAVAGRTASRLRALLQRRQGRICEVRWVRGQRAAIRFRSNMGRIIAMMV